jgi:hypothetical protein
VQRLNLPAARARLSGMLAIGGAGLLVLGHAYDAVRVCVPWSANLRKLADDMPSL